MPEFQVRDAAPALGAEIEGLDPRDELDAEAIRRLRSAFDERGALVVRNLDFDADDQAYVAGMLVGEEPPADRPAAEANARVYDEYVSNREPKGNAPFGRLLFHSDMMWADAPMELLSLYGVDVEQPSVPTVFASTTRAWQTLPDDLRARVEGLRAVHVTGQQMRGDNQEELLAVAHEQTRSTTKPIAHRHPRTGQTMLYVSQMMTSEIEGLAPEESEALLEELFAHLYSPANTWEHHWRNGDLVLWDNLAVQHARPDVTEDGPARTLRKVIAPIPTLQVSRPEQVRTGRAS